MQASSTALESQALAEAAALEAEAREQLAYERFTALRSSLQAEGKEPELTRRPEFDRWMDARHATDEAWGLWALATDALTGAPDESAP